MSAVNNNSPQFLAKPAAQEKAQKSVLAELVNEIGSSIACLFTPSCPITENLTRWVNEGPKGEMASREIAKSRMLDNFKRKIFYLDLSGLNLTTLPSCLASFTHLNDLNLSNNRLTQLPSSIISLPKLYTLGLSKNKIEELPRTISTLFYQEKPVAALLDLSENLLSKLPPEILDLPSCFAIDIGFNKFSNKGFKSLQEIIHAPGYEGPKFYFKVRFNSGVDRVEV